MCFLLGGSGTTIRHNTQITHSTQYNTPHSNRNTVYKTTQTIKDTLYTMNTMQLQLQLQLNKLILIKSKYSIHYRVTVMKHLMS
jgi:hypothetical protein